MNDFYLTMTYNVSTVITSGYWNPLHSGHISYLKEASLLAMRLIVIINNDKQVAYKKSIPFQTQSERCLIVSHLDMVDDVFLSIDEGGNVAKSIEAIVKQCRNQSDDINVPQILFANGGDAQYPNMQEQAVCKEYDVKIHQFLVV